MKLKILMAALFSLCLVTASYGQGWEQYYYNDTIPTAYALDQTADNGFILATSYSNSVTYEETHLLIKTDVNGDTLWTKELDAIVNNYYYLTDIQQTTDGGYILAGEINLINGKDMYLVKTNALGDTLWTNHYGGTGLEYCSAVQQTSDGGYIVVGTTTLTGNNRDLYLVKTDANGTVLWTQTYGGTGYDLGKDVQQTTDGGYIVIGSIDQGAGNDKDVYLVKTDVNGTITWTQTYGAVTDIDEGVRVSQTADGGYILGATAFISSGGSNIFLRKVDGLGVIQWSQSFGTGNYYSLNSLLQTNDGGYLLVGQQSYGENYMLKTTDLGVLEWNNVRADNNNTFVEAVVVGNGYAVVGHQWADWNNPSIEEHVYLYKTDSVGNTHLNLIKGNIFNDVNTNCSKDLGEQDFTGIIVSAVGSSRTWYGTTDALGNYCIRVDTGAYVVHSNEPTYWLACANNISVTYPNFYTIDTIDFPLQAQVNCPMMQVDLSAPFIRRTGGGSRYTINYCNNGTIDAINASVEVSLDADLDVVSTTLPIASQVGNVLSFNLGDVPYGDCGQFYIQVRANANAIVGQTHCSEAHIFPDSLCLPVWTGGTIEASANCQTDSIAFKFENVGSGLFNSETYYVFEDHFIMRTGNTGNILNGNDFNLTIAADSGKTYRISVPQNTGFPKLLGDSIASAAVEGCLPYWNGMFNTGFITQFSNGNASPFIAVDCQQSRGSFDPNDKAAQPAGYDAAHYIYSHTDLDYKVRFQNTGTDTAFLVVIRDTISPLLDLSTLEMGASSHNYTWRVYGDRVLEITYNNILLPDSTTNEPASHGFIRYRIEQQAGNIVGDVIYNEADIYFDFNAPITTNETYHTIGDNFVTVMLTQTTVLDEAIQVNVYPNPFTQNASLEVEGKDYHELQLTIYDVSGRMVLEKQAYSNNRIELSRGNLQPGVYFYQLLGDAALINTGKIVVQ
ncbi:MAG: Unknown protein [uncultured Aureispira sp.]|uniref:Uncharacterized protein n=1 Tax=uncultured Aureispira sp. TaxID=1331704 RepID=A0A6S6TLV5_9BACT|nr:MAG: Unknown protein [uncultured Aureispira sp.]